MRVTVLIKLGGSVITDKRHRATPRLDVIRRLAGEIAQAADTRPEALVLGHGAGSFGHVAAARHKIHRGVLAREQIPGVTATQDAAAKLHGLVIGALREAGAAVFSLAPSSFIVADAGKPRPARAEPLLLALRLGLVPVVFGDIVMDRAWGASICSTETVFRTLVGPLGRGGFPVRRAVWLGETEGILDAGGRTLPSIDRESAAEVLGALAGASGTDVTGGIRHRLATALALARRGVESWIGSGLEPGLLLRVLRGERVPGTHIPPAPR